MPGKHSSREPTVAIVAPASLAEIAEAAASRLRNQGYEVLLVTVERGSWDIDDELVCGVARSLGARGTLYLVVPRGSRVTSKPSCLPEDARVIKSIPNIAAAPDIIAEAGLNRLAGVERAETDLPVEWLAVVTRSLQEVRDATEGVLSAGRLRVPVRPPPILVASELYARRCDEAEFEEALRRASEGADVVVVGVNGESRCGLHELARLIRRIADEGVAVGVDHPDPGALARLLEEGADLGMSLTPSALESIPSRLRGSKAFVLIPGALAGWRSRVLSLVKAYARAKALGYEAVILDPVMTPFVRPGALEPLIASRELKAVLGGVPVMLGINNAYELADVDTHSAIAVLTFLAAEAGASMVLVSEESFKARGATLEARIAADMASLALKWSTYPKDLGINLLMVKGKRPEPT